MPAGNAAAWYEPKLHGAGLYHREAAELHGFPEKSVDQVVDSPFWLVIYTRHHFFEDNGVFDERIVPILKCRQDNDVLRSTSVGLGTFFFQHAETGPLRRSQPPLKHLDPLATVRPGGGSPGGFVA